MEIAYEKTVGHESDPELEQKPDINNIVQQPQVTCVNPKHYNLQEDSSEEDDLGPVRALYEGSSDCICCVCGKSFKFLNDLLEHFKVHKGEVRCHLCQVTFTCVISLALHLENAHSKYNLCCNSCNVRFRNTWHMNQHMEKHLEMFNNCKIEESDKEVTPVCSVMKKSLDEDVEEVIIKSEEVEITYLKEEEEQENEQENQVVLENGCVTKESRVTRTTGRAHVLATIFSDHNYTGTHFPSSPSVSDKVSAQNTRNSTRGYTDHDKNTDSESLHKTNDTNDSEESEVDQQKEVEVVVLRSVPRQDTGRVVLQARYEKVFKIQKLHCTTQETNLKSSLSSSVSVTLEPAQLENTIKVEDDAENNLWECAPIEEDIIKEEDEESIEIKEENESSIQDSSIDSPEEDLSSDTDSASVFANYSSDDSDYSSHRLLRTSKRLKTTKRNTNKNKEKNSLGVSTGLGLCSANEQTLSSEKVSTIFDPMSSLEKQVSSVKSIKSRNPQICSSCGLRNVPSLRDPMRKCKCMPGLQCNVCGVICRSDNLLLKHQAEQHPLTKYVCSSCLHVFPNQHSFTNHPCCTKTPSGQIYPPANTANNLKTPPMTLNVLPSPTSKQALNNGGSQVGSSLKFMYSKNVVKIVDTSQKICATTNLTIPLLPNNSSSTQTLPVPVRAAVPLNVTQEKVTSIGKDLASPLSTVTQANAGQMQLLIPALPSSSMMPAEVVLQGIVLPQQKPILATNPNQGFERDGGKSLPISLPSTSLPVSLTKAPLPVSLSKTPLPGTLIKAPLPVSLNKKCPPLSTPAPGTNQSKVALRTYTTTSTKVTVSFSPTPIKFSTPAVFSTSTMKTLPSATIQKFPGNSRTVPVPLPQPVPAPVCNEASTLAQVATTVQCSDNLVGASSLERSTIQFAPLSDSPLQIVAMFVNQSQELALQKRLRQSWRSKTIFPCRRCGAIARQPSLGVRHRYQHSGPRLHRCQCGRTFQQRLHLLRHQMQHAEATRYVCAACGQTFRGTRHLACHKVRFKFLKKNTTQECRNVFHCNCGQVFMRSSALLWHTLKNSKASKCLRKT
ncbi:uncharacterized protein [Hoplias malabaricus]|uniref:uncharacterized protein n=1 Tax=Hoplias malabaricus TaxID=27720 RepID=UPI003461FDB1